ncbi:MAG TPA: hypothetical protein VF469_08590 [Kofleriaceae bacterium]
MSERWGTYFAIFTAIGIATVVATAYIGGVAVDRKLWIGGDSKIVSEAAWLCTYGSMIGIVVMFAAPVTLLWQLGRRAFVPEQITPVASDGECGVGAYVAFLHIWTILVFAIAIVPGILWIRFANAGQASFQPGYLIPVAVALALAAAVVARFVANASVLRARYRKAIGTLGETWADVEGKKLAPDPTIAFIGENWWRLPATLGTMLLALWQILEWTGAARVITGVVDR